MKTLAMTMAIWVLFCSSVLGASGPDLPPEETAIKDTVDHWGLAFSDQLDAFKAHFENFSRQTGNKSTDYVLGVESSLRKTFPNKYWFKGQVTDTVEIRAGRNESQAFQLAIIPRMGFALNGVSISVGDLRKSDGKGNIPSHSFKLWRVGFVKTIHPQYPTRQVGAWPDPLLELSPFNIKGLELGLFWCEIKVPPAATPGDYQGTITVTASNAKPQTLTIKLRVWNFTLPDRVPFSTMVWTTGDMKSPHYLDVCRLFLEHHVDPISVGTTNDLKLLDKNLEFCLRQGLMHFQTPDFQRAEDFQAYYDHIKNKKWLDKALIYGAQDEPTERQLRNQVIPKTAMIRKAFPGLKVFLAGQYYAGLDQGVDVWLTDVSTRFDSWLKAGSPGRQQLWWYFCHLPIQCEMQRPLVDAPNMLIDNDAIEHRVAYWMAPVYKVAGFFIFAGNSAWPAGNEHWPHKPLQLTTQPYAYPYGGIHNGNGFLIYPDPRPSIRLKVLRDAAQDYWYITQVANYANTLPQAKRLIDGIRPAIFVDTHYFNRNPEDLLKYRAQLGEFLDRTSK